MAKAVGFDNILVKPAMYKSASKGTIPVSRMATPHIENALRGRLISTFADMLKGKNYSEMRAIINQLTYFDLDCASEDVANLSQELSDREGE